MTRKELVQYFLEQCSAGNSREVFEKYVADNFIHHNAYFKGDGNTLMEAMEEAAVSSPNKVFAIQRILEDGDMVASHSRVVKETPAMEISVMHIFRFEGDKIAELWDFGQIVPDDMPNENGMF